MILGRFCRDQLWALCNHGRDQVKVTRLKYSAKRKFIELITYFHAMGTTVSRVQIWRLLIVCASALLCVTAKGESLVVQVIPAPRQVEAAEGSFPLRDARVVLADAKSSDDRFAAQDFIDDLKATAGGSLLLARGGRRNILIGRIDSVAVAQALKRVNAT